MSTMPNFSAFFEALWGYEPFPWQTMLAERIANGRWPQALDLPTAAGKTACIDAAIYALAYQADTPVAERTAPRRIWFVVDRRIVVDEAFERAEAIASKLSAATGGPLKIIGDRLRRIGDTKCPLAVARLRGGILRDDSWARLPSQPAVITSTVDQLGSRIMFRGYGRSHLAAPIFAGLAAHDSLVVLDEAHCSIPFLQTLHRIETYLGEAWAELPLKTPFAFTLLSATLPQEIENAIFPGAEREAALNHPKLHDRIKASKVADLALAKAGRLKGEDPLVIRAAERAVSFIKREDKRRVAVIVNRVRTAEEIARNLGEQVGEVADVVLLTGRIRPVERDQLVQRWKPFLKASSPGEPEKPILFVSTQCIEVGADFSFDALVTECASLDALRQRFGRLNRMGAPGTAPAVILIREKDAKDSAEDPVYGTALSNTWTLLNDKARTSEEHKGQKTIDFGFEALDAMLDDIEDWSSYLAPKSDAPVLLPAHLDLLCQTAPTPQPDPDVKLYLHGKDRSSPEVRVFWRSDLSERRVESWVETIALCPPVSGEMLSVPLYRFRNWLAKSDVADDVADVEGSASDAPVAGADRVRPFLIWRGRDRSKMPSRDAGDVRANDVIALPASYGITGLGQATREQGFGESALDLWELAYKAAGRPPALRIHRATLEPWLACGALNDLVTMAEDSAGERENIQQAIDTIINPESPADDAAAKLPSWLVEFFRDTSGRRFVDHPDGGVIIFSTQRSRKVSEPDLFADDDDLTSALTPAGRSGVSLAEHSASVKYVVKRLATVCLPDGFADWLQLAAYYHDVGKLDERFQILLRHGNEIATAIGETAGEPLAKSADIPTSPARRRAIRRASRLPLNFRHEMLSLELARRHAPLPDDEDAAAIILHLIASHHGHARPFAPISPDPQPPPVTGRLGEIRLEISAEERSASIPAHHLNSGLSERFWQLTRRYGWWGLAYLEAILRLGDWYGSEFVLTEEDAEL